MSSIHKRSVSKWYLVRSLTIDRSRQYSYFERRAQHTLPVHRWQKLLSNVVILAIQFPVRCWKSLIQLSRCDIKYNVRTVSNLILHKMYLEIQFYCFMLIILVSRMFHVVLGLRFLSIHNYIKLILSTWLIIFITQKYVFKNWFCYLNAGFNSLSLRKSRYCFDT